MNRKGFPNFNAFSAGSHPSGVVRPEANRQLEKAGLSTANLRSKSWDEFAGPDAPSFHFVFTVCDNAAQEVCPFWPGQTMTAHWGVADPAAAEGSDADKAFAFRKALKEIETRIKLFINLPIDSLDGMTLQAKLGDIGKRHGN